MEPIPMGIRDSNASGVIVTLLIVILVGLGVWYYFTHKNGVESSTYTTQQNSAN